MKAEQLSVFLENRAGRLAEVTHTKHRYADELERSFPG